MGGGHAGAERTCKHQTERLKKIKKVCVKPQMKKKMLHSGSKPQLITNLSILLPSYNSCFVPCFLWSCCWRHSSPKDTHTHAGLCFVSEPEGRWRWGGGMCSYIKGSGHEEWWAGLLYPLISLRFCSICPPPPSFMESFAYGSAVLLFYYFYWGRFYRQSWQQ